MINIDKLTYAGNLNNLKLIVNNPNYKFYKIDIANKKEISNIFNNEKIDYVINFAAETHVDRSIENPEEFINTNILGTYTLLETIRNNNKIKNIKKYIQVSTDEVYGSLGNMGYFTEQTNLAPNSPYSASKASSDMIVRAYYKTYGIPTNITRCSNNYGSYQFPEKLIPLIIINALNNKDLPVYGNGLNIRDWIYVKDHCIAIDLVLHNGKLGEIYNIGAGNEITNIKIVKTILNILGKPESLIKYVKDRKGHDQRYAINASKIMNKLGWRPLHNFEKCIQETIQWYIDNEDWWKLLIEK